jgi:hypothetical protein
LTTDYEKPKELSQSEKKKETRTPLHVEGIETNSSINTELKKLAPHRSTKEQT